MLTVVLCIGVLNAQTERSRSATAIDTETTQDQIIKKDFRYSTRFASLPGTRGPEDPVIYINKLTPFAVYKGTVANPFGNPAIGNATRNIQCLEYIDGVLYAVAYQGGNQFGTVSQTNGAFTVIKTGFASDGASMAYNPVDKKVYVCPWTGDDSESTAYGTVDIETGNFTTIATFPQDGDHTYFMAIDEDGTAYAVRNLTNEFGTINLATGAFTQTATLSITANWIQDMSFDRETGQLYWMALSSLFGQDAGTYYKVNKANGELTQLSTVNFAPNSFSILNWFQSNADCNPIKDLKVEYNIGCTVAELTWNAPESGDFQYRIFRNGEEIAVVETESYSDDTFEPSESHTWTVRVICDEGVSIGISATKPACSPANCSRPKNFSAEYENCQAVLSWNTSYETLWDNTGTSNSGYESVRCMMMPFSHYTMADDFVIPANETWYIHEIYYGGFFRTSSGDYIEPDFVGVEIYKDNAGLPGELIEEEPYLTTLNGNLGATYQTILLPKTVVLTAGKYWLSIYGTYDNVQHDEFGYFIISHDNLIGDPWCRWDEGSGGWEFANAPSPSMFFRIQGSKNSEPYLFNIYKNNVLIAENVAENTYIDTDFDTSAAHTWSVKTVCTAEEGGGESAPVYANMPPCATVLENGKTSFKIAPNPSPNNIRITADSNFSMVEVINFLGQTVIAAPNNSNEVKLDVSGLNNGIYFVRITTNNGVSVQKFVKN